MLRQHAAGEATRFLIDGFPRNQENVDAWESVVGAKAKVGCLLFFECPLPVLEKRIPGRAEFTQRADDNIESLRKRFNTYKSETLPVVTLFEGKGQCVQLDSSLGRTEVYALVKDSLAKVSAPGKEEPLNEHSECLLGLRKWPKREKKKETEGKTEETQQASKKPRTS